MIGRRERSLQRNTGQEEERRAVIDIGSNTVRLVIYGGPARAPAILWNEKVSARLGRDLAETGTIPAAAAEEALSALARYAVLLDDMGIDDVEAVATAAPRDASNGGEFLASAAALGFDIRLLTGADEARASAFGAIGAFPEAKGIVADLGGGSLELVPVADGMCANGVSLPLGTLRLPPLRESGGFTRKVEAMIASAGVDAAIADVMYMIGGTWRALAVYAMDAANYPLTDPHAFTLSATEAFELASVLHRARPPELARIRGISTMRAEKLPDAAALLRVLLNRLNPNSLVFSSWGLREGLHFSRLDAGTRSLDPFEAGVSAFARSHASCPLDAALRLEWTAAVAASGAVDERIMIGACYLAPALQSVEPNLRAAYAVEWALDKRWIGIDPTGRGMLAAILLASLGRSTVPDRVKRLVPSEALPAAIAAGLALRIAHRLGAGSEAVLRKSTLKAVDGALRLTLPPTHAALATPLVGKDLALLAAALALEPALALDG